jgi:cell division cycle 20-like protein 1 (cofactor of APC complex)
MFESPKKKGSVRGDSRGNSQNKYSASKSTDRYIPQQIKSDLFTVMKDKNFESESRQNDNQDSKLNHTLVEEHKLKSFDLLLQKEVIKKPLWNDTQSKCDSFSKRNSRKIFSFSNFAIKDDLINFEENNLTPVRVIQSTPYKILDAPGLEDDFYLNVLDWTRSNMVIVSLGNNLYNWCPIKGKATKMLAVPSGDNITALKGSPDGSKLALGFSSGKIKILDIEKQKIETGFSGQIWRIGALSWRFDSLASGSRDKSIHINDVRSKGDSSCIALQSHRQEVCGVGLNFSAELLASGGNDNKLVVWDLRRRAELFSSLKHTAAVKAIEWSPHSTNLLFSGGGTHDQTIKTWNMNTCSLQSSVDSGSQVCAIRFSPNSNEFVSAHGYSQNYINIWSMQAQIPQKFAVLQGHTSRVLYLAVSPDGRNIVTGAGDESLRFWEVFSDRRQNEQDMPVSKMTHNLSEIR